MIPTSEDEAGTGVINSFLKYNRGGGKGVFGTRADSLSLNFKACFVGMTTLGNKLKIGMMLCLHVLKCRNR